MRPQKQTQSTQWAHKVRPYSVRFVRCVISIGEETDKSEFEGFKQISPKQILGAIKTIAFPWREGGPLAVDEWTP